MPKIGMESLYQGYLQNLEAEKSKKTRRPTATQYTDKQPNERNDFDRFCMAVETMRKALGPNVPFGNDNFIRGYYEISKKRKHEIGEAEFTSVFGDPNDKRIKACLDGVNKLAGRRERNEFYEKAPEAPRRKSEDPQRGGPKLGG